MVLGRFHLKRIALTTLAMDPALLKQKEAFKKRLEAATASQPRPKKEPQKKEVPKHKKSSKALSRPPPQPIAKLTGDGSARSINNPHRVLKSVMDMLKERYSTKNYESLSFDEIISLIERQDITVELSQWLEDALRSNPKVSFASDSQTYLFKPTLGLGVRNRRQLLELLKEYNEEGRGGIPMSDIREAVYNPERAIRKLDEDGLLVRVTRSDKEEIIFYNNPEYVLSTPISKDFQELWNRISVDGLTETDIENHLKRVGLGAMMGQGGDRKRKAPSQQRRSRKRAKNVKILNTHLDSELFTDEVQNPH